MQAKPASQTSFQTSPQTRLRGVFGGGALQIGRVAGIPLAVDATWVLIFLLVTLSLHGQMAGQHTSWSGTESWLAAGAASLLFFASILLHELGHSLVALRVGVEVRSITLFVFGGVAQLASEPRRPRDEIGIALAGPAVSFALAAAFHGLAQMGLAMGLEVAGDAALWLGRINLTVAIFNLVPGFPLDGGRVLRGILWAKSGSFTRATRLAGAAGAAFAYVLIGLGILVALVGRNLISGLWLAFIGWFLLNAARGSVSQGVLQSVLSQVRVRELMEPIEPGSTGPAIAPDVPVSALADAVLHGGRRTFYVTDAGQRLVGLVTLGELAAVPIDERSQRRAQDIMVPRASLQVIGLAEDGFTALQRMVEGRVNQLPVLDGDRVVGALTRERLLALVQARLALGSRSAETAQA